MTRNIRQRFTLVEMLVVIAVISILSSLLLPALGKAKDTARRITCTSNFRQLHLGISYYSDDNSNWMPPCNVNGTYVYYIDEYLKAKGKNGQVVWVGATYFTAPGGLYFCPGAPWPPPQSPAWPAGAASGALTMSTYNLTATFGSGDGGWYMASTAPYRRANTMTAGCAIMSETNYCGNAGGLNKTPLLWLIADTACYPSASHTGSPAFNYHSRSANFLFLDGHVSVRSFTGAPLFGANWLEL